MDKDQQPSRLDRIKNVDISKKTLKKRARWAEAVTIRHARRFILKRLDNARDVQRNVVLWLIAIAVMIGLTGLQLAWYRDSYVSHAKSSGGVYAEGIIGEINSLNPIFADSDSEEAIGKILFSRLLKYDSKGYLSPDLASSYSMDSSGTKYNFVLRSDAKWHDGTKVNVDDVIYTFDLIKNSATRSTLSGWDNITVQKVDDKTVSFTTPVVIAAFLHAIETVPILPKHILESVSPNNVREANFSLQPVGNGPFKLRLVQDINSNKLQKVVILDANDNYFMGRPMLDRFEIHTYKSSMDLEKALKNREISGASGLESQQLSSLSNDNYEKLAQPLQGGVFAMLNTTREPLNDRRVRKALQLSLDTEAVRSKLALKVPSINVPFTQEQVGRGLNYKTDSIDINKANQLLDEAGYSLVDGLRVKSGKPLTLTIATVQGEYEDYLQVFVDQWKAIGITVTTNVYDPTDATQRFVQDILQPRNYDVLIYPVSIGGDMDVYAYWHSSQANARGFNFANYSNRISDDALNSARTRLESDLRIRKYNTFVNQWIQDVPAIGLYQTVLFYAHTKNTNLFEANSVLVYPIDRYSNVSFWSANSKNIYKTP